MASWRNMKRRINATVRSTIGINAYLNESMLNKRKTMVKWSPSVTGAAAVFVSNNRSLEQNENNLNYLYSRRTNFNMEEISKLVEATIDERLTWDRQSRQYNSGYSLIMAQELAAEIRQRIRNLNYQRHRIVCTLSIMEKQYQGMVMSMCHLLDQKMDNFITYTCERPTYFIIAVVYMVYLD